MMDQQMTNQEQPTAENDDNELLGLLNDFQGPMREGAYDEDEEDFGDKMHENTEQKYTTNIVQELMDEAPNLLYHGCIKFSSLNFLVKLIHIKVLNNWTNKFFDMLLNLLKNVFSIDTCILSSFYEVKRKLRDLGLEYDYIHACKYDCVLFWKRYSNF